ncbi:hypothetical protein Vadar_026110 [Vaccinium darrowii]|uniref:Uncharacterized protein n=1 Tax=Vaccinium darrowii TaxID=229202 RepID=A0ACB7ZEE2_9ERIC|nr:hypothetical protein Vadar_026110 [Vaccinium darrowii]
METMAETYFIFAILLLPLLLPPFLKHFKSTFLSKTLPLPPGPIPWPILGNIPHMGKKPHITLAKFAQSYGPLMSLKLGSQLLIVGSSPAAAAEILKTHDQILSARHLPHVLTVKSPELNHVSLAWAFDCNDKWKYLRTICRTELFSGKAMESQAVLREKKVIEMVEFLRGKEGEVVGIVEVVFATVFNMLSNVMMSRDFIRLGEENLGGGMKGLIRSIMEVVSAPNLCDFYPILGGLDLQGLKRRGEELVVRIFAMWELDIEERKAERRRSSVSSCRDFLDSLLDNAFSNDQINYLIGELFTAGTDTSISVVEWTMAELIKHPESMTKVCQELATEINQSNPKESHLPQLAYLQACIKEALRLHPPVPFLLPHRALVSCEVMNYTIPKDARVIVNVWAIGRDPTIWDDPLQFKPERFLNSTLDYKGNDYEFLPFGAGRRICPGLSMAAKHVPLILASLIHFFEWSLPGENDPTGLDMNEKFAVTLQKEQPLLLIPKVRK